MNRIEIRGIIVPSEFDGGWYESLIERGVITPESRFRKALAEASPDEPLEVYVNTPGGSVFAGNEMVNAVLAWKAATGQKVNMIVGAMAASMGSAFTVQAADHVSAYKNSLMMFHGAWGVQIGGSEAMKDYSDVLDKLNAHTKSILLSKYELTPETIEEWYAEGREGWLTADEMKAAGIAQTVIGEDDEALDLSDIDVGEFEQRGLKIAALVKGLAEMKEAKGGEGDDGVDAAKKGAGNKGADGDGAADNDGPQEATGEPASEDTAPEPEHAEPGTPAPDESILARAVAGESMVLTLKAELDTTNVKLDASIAEARKLQGERDQARAAHDKTKETLTEANAKITRLLSGGLTFAPTVETWEKALALSGDDYEKARKEYPEVYRAQREQDKANRK